MQAEKKVYLIGIGMGNGGGLTVEARNLLREGDIFVGAGRMLELLPESHVPRLEAWEPGEIGAYLRGRSEWRRACILLSGDVGFYSGAKRLVTELADFDLELIPGVSSIAAFCAKLRISWEDISFGSLHGKKENWIAKILCSAYTFLLLGGEESLMELCGKLLYYRMDDVMLHVGEWLGYPQERIVHGTASQIQEMSFDRLLTVVAENRSPRRQVSAEIPDEEFIRGRIPMTKSEVRTVSIQKLGLERGSVLYDIGAGTGTVSIQAGLCCPDCTVYAVEEKTEAQELIERNKRKFAADNVTVTAGQAPGALEELPPPTHVFVGGSGGKMRPILQCVYKKNPAVTVVLNFVSLEGLAEITGLIREWDLKGVELLQVGVSKGKEIGNSHLLMAQNPVTIVRIPAQKRPVLL